MRQFLFKAVWHDFIIFYGDKKKIENAFNLKTQKVLIQRLKS